MHGESRSDANSAQGQRTGYGTRLVSLTRFLTLILIAVLDATPPVLAAGAAASEGGLCATPPAVPRPPHNARRIFSAAGGDDYSRIRQTIDELHPGDWLVFEAGPYEISRHLSIGVNGVTLYGPGAIIHATSASDGALVIEGDNVALYGFTITQDSKERMSTPSAGGISVVGGRNGGSHVVGAIIQNNTVNNSAAAGIFLYKASGFTIANNRVYRSWADGIHVTGGSSNGRVIHNTVLQTGDDMIAVVSYAGTDSAATPAAVRYKNWPQQQDELDQNIYIGSNVVSDQYSGRGISVVGGSDITIESNTISKTARAAAIYLTRENSYGSFGDRDVMVRNNNIRQVQTRAPTYMPPGFNPELTHHGAIEIAALMADDEANDPTYRNAFSVTGIALIGNHVSDARFPGIRIGMYSPPGAVSQVMIKDNVLTHVGSGSVVQEYPGFESSTGVCINNMLDGVNWGSQCDKSVAPVSGELAVQGASLACDSSGRVADATR
jgi:parallel beta-helix repeat protein